MKLDGSQLEVVLKWKKTFQAKKILVLMGTKLYGSHMDMEGNLSGIKNISLDRNKTVWKSAGSHMEMEKHLCDIKNNSLDRNETVM